MDGELSLRVHLGAFSRIVPPSPRTAIPSTCAKYSCMLISGSTCAHCGESKRADTCGAGLRKVSQYASVYRPCSRACGDDFLKPSERTTCTTRALIRLRELRA